MKASKLTDAWKALVVKREEKGTAFAEICRKAGISQATYFNWKKRYAGWVRQLQLLVDRPPKMILVNLK